MATTGGFLQEPQPGYVSHSEISAVFVTKPSYLDAAMFLAETAAPAALTMGTGIGHDSDSDERKDGVSCLSPFATAREAQLPRLQRQWPAYLRYGTGHVCDTVTDVLTCLEGIRTVNESTVVEVVLLPLSFEARFDVADPNWIERSAHDPPNGPSLLQTNIHRFTL